MTISIFAFAASSSAFYETGVVGFCLGGLMPATPEPPTNTVDFAIFPSPEPVSSVTRTIRYAVENYDDLLRKLAD